VTDWTTRSRVKIKRAKKHIEEFIIARADFIKTDPYAVIEEQDPETGDLLYRAVVRSDTPDDLGAIAGDAIHNLRTVLDGLIHHLVLASGWKPSDTLHFPFFKTRHECETTALGEIKRSSQAAVDKIKDLKPYPLGNTPLWLIHRLDNRDKHQGLTTAGVALIQVFSRIRGIPTIGAHSFTVTPSFACPLKDGAILYRITAAMFAEMEVQTKFVFDVAFSEVEMAEGEPILPFLHHLTDVIQGIVDDFATITLTPRKRGR
jgi:hypothetical protein